MRDWPLSELLDAVAARTAAPGGGSAAGSTCALAAALVEMAAGFGPAELQETGARAAQLRELALELAERELHSYEPVLEALKLARDDPHRDERLSAARGAAADAPLEIARTAAELARLAAHAAHHGNPHLAGDAVTGALLAEAACRAAANLVAINLANQPEDSRRYEAYDLGRSALQAREKALQAG